jgi:hypothetical protein
MAYSALVSGLLFPLLLTRPETSEIGAVAIPFYTFVGSVVGAYVGFSTIDDKWKAENENHDLATDEGLDQ